MTPQPRLDWVKLGVREGHLDTLFKPIVWHCIGNIINIFFASTTSEDANDATIGISNDRSRIPWCRESSHLMAVLVDGHHYRCRANGVVLVFPDEGFEAGRATDGKTGGATVLDDEERLYAGCVEHGWLAQLVLLNDILELKEAVIWKCEGLNVVKRVRPRLLVMLISGSWSWI